MERAVCRRCGVETLRLTCFDGVVRPFHVRESTNQDVDPAQRWYISRHRGAVSGADVTRPVRAPFLTQHVCRRTRTGAGETEAPAPGRIPAGGAIARRDDLPTADRTPLRIPGYRWTYRWPSSFAHVVPGRAPQALCGAAVQVPEDMSGRERARIASMHVCPRCLRTYARHER